MEHELFDCHPSRLSLKPEYFRPPLMPYSDSVPASLLPLKEGEGIPEEDQKAKQAEKDRMIQTGHERDRRGSQGSGSSAKTNSAHQQRHRELPAET